jgi:hypothetical protein
MREKKSNKEKKKNSLFLFLGLALWAAFGNSFTYKGYGKIPILDYARAGLEAGIPFLGNVSEPSQYVQTFGQIYSVVQNMLKKDNLGYVNLSLSSADTNSLMTVVYSSNDPNRTPHELFFSENYDPKSLEVNLIVNETLLLSGSPTLADLLSIYQHEKRHIQQLKDPSSLGEKEIFFRPDSYPEDYSLEQKIELLDIISELDAIDFEFSTLSEDNTYVNLIDTSLYYLKNFGRLVNMPKSELRDRAIQTYWNNNFSDYVINEDGQYFLILNAQSSKSDDYKVSISPEIVDLLNIIPNPNGDQVCNLKDVLLRNPTYDVTSEFSPEIDPERDTFTYPTDLLTGDPLFCITVTSYEGSEISLLYIDEDLVLKINE